MMRYFSLAAVALLAGCMNQDKAPLLSHRAELQFNTDQVVRVVGTARYSKMTGASVVGDDFELRVYPKDSWGPDENGKKVEVTGTIHDAAQATPPDPSVLPGEYWIGDAKWTAVTPPENK